MTAAAAQVRLVAARSVRRTLRQPVLVVPTLLFPLLLLAVNSAGLADATRIPGFPADSYLDFAIVVPFMQAALFAAVTAGTGLATDIQKGFLDRLQLTPLRRVAILLGQLAGATALALVGAVVYVAVGLVAGVGFASGPLGVVVLIAFAVYVALAFAGIGSLFGARTGSAEAVQGLFPLIFVLFFLSTMNMPADLIEVGWYRAIAAHNPVSWLIDALRSLVIEGWDAGALAAGLATATGILVLSFALASRALATRMGRT
ncbi:MAG TPA: ABC transporter permease [Solirubrobacteraceae bacterium]|nr:ABC transporter permease [Solirubrobacteraceae bacterium]